MRARHVPLRTCLVCGLKAPKPSLMRIVRTVDGPVEIDATGKKAGRGGYICPRDDCWEGALEKGHLERALHVSVTSEVRKELRTQYEEQRQPVVEKGGR